MLPRIIPCNTFDTNQVSNSTTYKQLHTRNGDCEQTSLSYFWPEEMEQLWKCDESFLLSICSPSPNGGSMSVMKYLSWMKSSQILSARHLIFFKTFSLNFDYHLLSSPLPCMRWLNRCTSFLNVHLLIPALYVLFSFCFISALTFFHLFVLSYSSKLLSCLSSLSTAAPIFCQISWTKVVEMA